MQVEPSRARRMSYGEKVRGERHYCEIGFGKHRRSLVVLSPYCPNGTRRRGLKLPVGQRVTSTVGTLTSIAEVCIMLYSTCPRSTFNLQRVLRCSQMRSVMAVPFFVSVCVLWA